MRHLEVGSHSPQRPGPQARGSDLEAAPGGQPHTHKGVVITAAIACSCVCAHGCSRLAYAVQQPMQVIHFCPENLFLRTINRRATSSTPVSGTPSMLLSEAPYHARLSRRVHQRSSRKANVLSCRTRTEVCYSEHICLEHQIQVLVDSSAAPVALPVPVG